MKSVTYLNLQKKFALLLIISNLFLGFTSISLKQTSENTEKAQLDNLLKEGERKAAKIDEKDNTGTKTTETSVETKEKLENNPLPESKNAESLDPKTEPLSKAVEKYQDDEHAGARPEISYSPEADMVNKNRLSLKDQIASLEKNGLEGNSDLKTQISGNELKPQAAMVGFSSSTLANNSANVNVKQSFTVEIPSSVFNLDPKIWDKMEFYPSAKFSTVKNGNKMTVYPERLDRMTNYSFGYRSIGLCAFANPVPCQAQTTVNYNVSFTTSFKEYRIYGYSLQGRPLEAWLYGKADGNGKTLMLNGGIHGNEWNSGGLSQFRNELENRPEWFAGKNKAVIVIPFVNPDGTAKNNIYDKDNARGVNLNRNWPAYWAPAFNRGAFALSEPETLALYNLTLAEKVTHLISYHAQWPPDGIIFLGDDFNLQTKAWGEYVANKTGYVIGYFPGEDIVSGDQAVWASGVGIQAIVIEATYLGNTDYAKNYPMYADWILNY